MKAYRNMRRELIALFSALLLAVSVAGSHALAEAAPQLGINHSRARLSLQGYLEGDPGLMALMEKSIGRAHEINPDPNTNPVDSVEKLYDFVDWITTCMPWELLTDAEYPTLYRSIDQSIDYFWFLLDQPLEELEGLGYYYPTLQYHEPIASWCKEYSDEWGAFLSSEESWNDIYYQRIKNDPSMNMQNGWYANSNVWKTFNEWFSRHLINLLRKNNQIILIKINTVIKCSSKILCDECFSTRRWRSYQNKLLLCHTILPRSIFL